MNDTTAPASVPIDEPPAERIRAAIDRLGEHAVAVRAAGLLSGRNEGDDFLLWVGGRHAQGVLDGAPPLYWPEVWGARALLYAWDDAAAGPVLAGLGNRAWRVREMCVRVCAARGPDAAGAGGAGLGSADALATLTTDEVPRVRAAVARALSVVGGHAQAESLEAMFRDADKDVRRAARQAFRALMGRLGRSTEQVP